MLLSIVFGDPIVLESKVAVVSKSGIGLLSEMSGMCRSYGATGTRVNGSSGFKVRISIL